MSTQLTTGQQDISTTGAKFILLILIFLATTWFNGMLAQNLAVDLYINEELYPSTSDLIECEQNKICLRITNTTSSTQTIKGRIGIPPAFFSVTDLGVYDFIGGIYHEYELDEEFEEFEVREFCMQFVVINHDYSSLLNRYSGNIVPIQGSSDQVNHSYLMPNVDISNLTYISGTPMKVSDAITASLLLPLNQAVNTQQYIFIDGVLEVDENYMFFGDGMDNSIIKMGSNTKIVINEGVTMVLQHTDINGCYFLWESIELMPGSKLAIVDSKVEDGIHAVRLLSSDTGERSSLICERSTFFNNFIGVRVEESPGAISSSHSLRMLNNEFNSDRNLYPVDGVQNQEVSTKAYSGLLVLNHSGVSLGNAFSSNPNTFKNLTNGISLYNSTMRITDAIFEDISEHPEYEPLEGNGAGIYSKLSVLRIEDNQPVIFDRVRHGVLARQTDLSSRGAEILKSHYGFNIVTPYMFNTRIFNSQINSSNYGIRYILGRLNIANLLLEENEIHIGINESGIANAGILVNPLSLFLHNDDTDIIQYNLLNHYNSWAGIHIRSIRGGFIADGGIFERLGGLDLFENEVELMDEESFSRSGIVLEGGEGNHICKNLVFKSEFINDATIAIEHRNSRMNEMELNEVDKTRTGLLYWGNCSAPGKVKTTFFNNHQIGLSIGRDEVNPSGIILRQVEQNQNRWRKDPASTGYHAINHDLLQGGMYNEHEFFVYERETYEPLSESPLNWIDRVDENPIGYSDACTFYRPFELDGPIVSFTLDTYEFVQFDAEQRWMAKFHLFGEASLIDSSYRANNYQVLDSFYHAEKNGSIGIFNNFIKSSSEGMHITTTIKTDLAWMIGKITTFQTQLLDSNSIVITGLPDSIDYVRSFEIMDSLLIYQEALNDLYFELDSTVRANMADKLSLINSLPDTFLVEYNLKYTLRSILAYLASDNLDSILNLSTELESIAEMCPLEGGLGVYFARDLLANQDIQYPDDYTCAILAFGDMKLPEQGEERKVEEITVYPNPSRGVFNIQSESDSGFERCMAQVLDLQGRVVAHVVIPEGTRTQELSLLQQPSGTYLLSIMDPSGKVKFSKIIELIK